MKAAFVLPKPPCVSLLGWSSCSAGLAQGRSCWGWGGLQGAAVPGCPIPALCRKLGSCSSICQRSQHTPGGTLGVGATDTPHSGPLKEGSWWGGGHRCSPLAPPAAMQDLQQCQQLCKFLLCPMALGMEPAPL